MSTSGDTHIHHDHHEHHHESNGITPEKLAIMKLESGDAGFGLFDGPASPTASHRGFGFNSSMNSSSRSAARSGRQLTRKTTRQGSRRSSVVASHRSKMSAELTSQAEAKFFALIELMANASREASSLKELWSRIVSERESSNREREELLEQIEEVSEELERNSSDQHNHGHELIERKKQVERLLLELSAAVSNVSVEKKKVVERDLELDRLRSEIRGIRDTNVRSVAEHEKVRKQLEILQMTFKSSEGDRDSAREEADRYQREIQRLVRERTETSTRLSDITSKYELSRKEILTTNDRIKMFELERGEQAQELDILRAENRKTKTRVEEVSKEVVEVSERYERLTRESAKLRETVRTVETERDDSIHTIEHLRRDLKNVHTSREEAEERTAEVNLKYDHMKRELLAVKEKLRDVELERTELHESHERLREQHRLIIVEREELKDELNTANRKHDNGTRQTTVLTESLHKTESTLADVRSEVYTLTERIKQLTRERDDHHHKHGHLVTEITELKGKIVLFQAEIRTISEARDRVRAELERTQRDYEEVTETITTFKDDSGELEFEIESLRTMLRESREQKERAITARTIADRERDEYIAKYEEKCREMERFEESASAHYHASSKGESRVSTSRVVSRAQHSSSHQQSSSQNGEGHVESHAHEE